MYVGGDVNLWERVPQKSHKHWFPMNNDDSSHALEKMHVQQIQSSNLFF